MLVPQSPFPSPLTKKLSKLDEEMKSILENTELGEATKAMLYSNVLSQYLDVKRQMQLPQRIPIVEEGSSMHGASKIPQPIPNPAPEEINISIIPPLYRNRARNLISDLRDHTNTRWNVSNDLVIDDTVIPGSNIVDLLDDTVRTKSGPSPIGVKDFRKVLEDSNAPQSLIGNKRFVKPTEAAFETPPSTPKRLSPLNATIKRLEFPKKTRKIKGQTGRGACRRKAERKPALKWESL